MATRGISAGNRPFPNAGTLKDIGEVARYLNELGNWAEQRFSALDKSAKTIPFASVDDLPPLDGGVRLNYVPNDPVYGQVLIFNGVGTSGTDTGWYRLVPSGTASGTGVSIPAGGTASQILGKVDGADYHMAWQTPHYVPAGGTAGQVFTKTSGTDYAAAWQDPTSTFADITVTTLGSFGTVSSGPGHFGSLAEYFFASTFAGGAYIGGAGTASQVDVYIEAKGSDGLIYLANTSQDLFRAYPVASGTNWVSVQAGAAGDPGRFFAEGADTNIGLVYDAKNAGVHKYRSYDGGVTLLQIEGDGTNAPQNYVRIQAKAGASAPSIFSDFGTINFLSNIQIVANKSLFVEGTSTFNETFWTGRNYGQVAGGTAPGRLALSNNNAFGVYWGTGSATVTAGKGSLYLRGDGAAPQINTDGTSSWAPIGAFNGAIVYSTATQTVTSGAAMRPSWSAAVYDLGPFFSTASPTRLTIGAGVSYVRVSANIEFDDGVLGISGTRRADIWKNGSAMGTAYAAMSVYALGTGDTSILNLSTPVLAVGSGDYFELNLSQNSGTAATIPPAGASWLAIEVKQ